MSRVGRRAFTDSEDDEMKLLLARIKGVFYRWAGIELIISPAHNADLDVPIYLVVCDE